jgi:transposase
MIHQDFRSLAPQAQETLRLKAMAALQAGRSKTEVARLFGVTRQAIHGWVNRKQEAGVKALRARRRGRLPGGRLGAKQERKLCRLITDHCPDQLKLPFYLWTREAVAHLIAQRFRVRLSVWTAGRLLAKWGFTPQKPARMAFEQDSQAVHAWLKHRYPAIRALARREKAMIFWEDEMGLRGDHAAGRSFSPKGRTPVILGTGQRFRCNLISAITNRGHLQFMVFKARFTVAVFLKFLRRLLRQNRRRRIFLILDGHPVHLAGTTLRWFKRHRAVLRVYFLPGYSPELNPDEYLNQDVKANAVGRARPLDRAELVGNVRAYLRTTQAHPTLVKRYFQEDHVRYASL